MKRVCWDGLLEDCPNKVSTIINCWKEDFAKVIVGFDHPTVLCILLSPTRPPGEDSTALLSGACPGRLLFVSLTVENVGVVLRVGC